MQKVKTKAKRSLSWLLVLAMIMSLCVMPAGAALADDEPDMKIGTLEELQAFATNVDNGESYAGKTVVLTADIDASGVTWNPIGEKADSKSFRGTFDGQGHTVTLNISSASGYNGLFCYNFGTIKNVKVAGTIETTKRNAMYNGAVCAMNKSSGVVDSCINEAICTYGGGYSSGIVGQNAVTGTVSNCINRAAVSVDGTMGGAITCGGTITYCLNVGTLSGKAYNISYSGNVTNSYYLDSSSSPTQTRLFSGTSMTETELKKPGFAKTLGKAFTDDPNGGFPVLAWELAGDTPVETPKCSVSVSLSGTGNINSKFSVPLGSSLNITWKFVEKNDIPYGWAMVINDVEPTIKYAQSVYENDSVIYDENAIAPIKIENIASMMTIFNTGVPENYTFTPTEEQCSAGEVVKETITTNEIAKEDLEFKLVFINKDTDEVIGSYYGDDGTGYHAKSLYGEQTISSKDVKLYNWFGQHYPGYRLYRGTVGNYDTAPITLVVDQNGVVQKEVKMLAEVNHGSKTYHSQNVKFVCDGETVLETSVPLTNGFVNEYTDIALDLTAAAEKLAEMGYVLDTSKTYTVKCNNYTHTPEVTEIEVAASNPTIPYEYTVSDEEVTITKYLGSDETVNVPAEIEGKPVVAMAIGAFAKNEAIKTVVLPDSIKTIGQSAFAGCANLERINVENVTSFGPYAFFECAALKNVEFNDTIETLPVYLFSECSSLESVKLPKALKALSNHLFDACENLKSVDIPSEVTLIDRSAFENAGIETIVIPDSVKEIGDYAFENAPLTSVSFGKNVEKFGSLVFWGCNKLTNIVIPDKVTKIPYGTFFKCTALSTVTIGRNVTAIDDTAFNNCPAAIRGYSDSAAFTFAKANNISFSCIEHIFTAGDKVEATCTEDGYTTYTCACGEEKHDNIVKAKGHSLDMNSAEDNGDGTHTGYCWNCDEYITQPHSYDEDGFCTVCYAEHAHKEFTYVNFSDYVHHKICKDCGRTVSEAHAWNDGVTDGNKVTYTCTLCGETKVESTSPFTYTVNDGKATITGLRDKTVTVAEIPETIDGYTVTAIADNAFAFEKEITKVVIPNTVTTIGEKAFYNCWALAEVKLGDAVVSIGDDAFGFAKALKTIDIPDSVKTIGAEAFARSALTEISIGKDVAAIGDSAFLDCESLKAINVAAGNAVYSSKDGVLFDKSGETLIQYPSAKEGTVYVVPDGVKTIGVKAFYQNAILEKVELSNSVISIEKAAFSYSQIKNITLGNSLESIAEAAFERCTNLENVTFPGTLKTIGKAAFYLCTSITEVVIPDSVTTIGKSAFQKDTGIKTVILGTGVKTIGAAAFGNNANLETFKVFSKEDITWNGYAVFDIALDGLTVYGYCDSGLKDYCKTATTNFEAMHSYKDGVCTVCGEKDPNYKPPAPPVHTHTVVIDQAVAATCTKSGLTEGKHCSVCKAIIVAQQEIKALGHTPEEVAAVAATCTTDGMTAGTKCSVCGTVLSGCEVVKALGHDFKDGKCTRCGEKDPNYVPPVVNPFKDVEKSSPYYDAIIWAADKGVTTGKTADTFGINDGCTRAQIVTFLYRAAGSPEVKADTVNPFTDVSKDSVYYNAILWAVEKGITKGTTETTFDPNAVCTRGQIVTFLFRASGDEKVATGTDFADVASGSYCADAVAWAVANKVANGFADGTFRPEATCTRGQAVTFIYRALAK